MRKVMTIFGAIIFASTLFTSCGGCNKTEPEVKTETIIIKEVPAPAAEPAQPVAPAGIDRDQFVKNYSAFADSYIKLVKKRRDNPRDPSILIEYTDAAAKALVMQKDAKACTNSEHAAEILEIANRIAKATL